MKFDMVMFYDSQNAFYKNIVDFRSLGKWSMKFTVWKYIKCKWLYIYVTGIQTSEDARFYALSAKFEPFSNEGKTLVIQFTVKHEQNIDCGGGYVKVFNNELDQKDMHGDSAYQIMFG